MGSLSSAIVEREIATMRQVEEALARQVLYGGDLATNLLEVLGGTSEGALTYVLAEHYALRPAPTGELPRASDELLRAIAGETAGRYGFSPLGLENGAVLVAVAEPLPHDVENELTTALGMPLVQLAAPLVRIRQALARDYKIPLDRRTVRLLARLEGLPDPNPSSAPPPLQGGSTTRVPRFPRPFGEEPQTRPGVGEGAPDSEPGVAAPAYASGTQRLIQWMARSAQAHAGQRARRHRGPMTVAVAEEALATSTHAQDALQTFFDFARQYFTYSALFLVVGDLAEGRDAYGPGADRDRVISIGLTLDLPSCLRLARDRRAPVCVPLAPDGLDATLANDLGRHPKGDVAVVPVVVRERVVALVYGDDGEQSVGLDQLGDVVGMASLTAATLERLAVARKKTRAPGSDPPPSLRRETLMGMPSPVTPVPTSPVKEKKAEALVRALGLPAPERPVTIATAPGGDAPKRPATLAFEAPVAITEPAPAMEPDAAAGTEETPAAPEATDEPPPVSAPQLDVAEAEEDESFVSELLANEQDRAPVYDEKGFALSRASYHPPRPPPPPSRRMNVLPSIIVGQDKMDLVDRLVERDDDDTLTDVLRDGVEIVPVLLSRLPGPLAHGTKDLLEGRARPSTEGPILRALVALRRTALPFIVVHSANVDRVARLFATLLLGELPYPEAASAIASRLFDPEADVRAAALVAARFLKASPDVFAVLVHSLEKTLRATNEPEERRATAAMALGELTVTASIPLLLATVEAADVPVKTAAIAALRHVTLQDFGDDVAKWDRWWAKNGDRDRAEWLMDALTHAAPDVRAQAIRELSPVLPFDVSKFESLSEAGRVALQDRCRAWWKGDRSDRPGPLDRDGRA